MGYEIVERNGHKRFIPFGEGEPIVKQRLERIRDWVEGGNPDFGGVRDLPPI